MWRDGKAELKDMVDQRGRPLRVRELNNVADAGMVASMVKTNARKTISNKYDDWLASALSGNQRKDYALLGEAHQDVIDFLKTKDINPLSPDIVINDRIVVGKKADRHKNAGNALSAEEWRSAPAMLKSTANVLYDKVDNNLLYVYPVAGDDKIVKVVVEINVYDKKLEGIYNQVSTAFKINGNALLDKTRYIKIR